MKRTFKEFWRDLDVGFWLEDALDTLSWFFFDESDGRVAFATILLDASIVIVLIILLVKVILRII